MQPSSSPSPLIGQGRRAVQLRHEIARIAPTNFTVLIQGESGSGKELVARQIHAQSTRRSGPFVAVNCAAIVDTLFEAELFGIEDRTATGVRGRAGKFEISNGGTLFLDEVADLSEAAQAKLLRAVQEMTVERVGSHSTRSLDVRLIAATNRRLRIMVDQHGFREDLYYRLSGVEIHVPPLRERPSDIPLLAGHFLQRYSGDPDRSLSASAIEVLRTHRWPGNVRQLQRAIEHAVAFSMESCIRVEDLPVSITGDYATYLQPSLVRDDTMRAWGSRYARMVLDRCDNNKRQACRMLGISYHTLQSYLRYDTDRERASDTESNGPDKRRDSPGATPPAARG